MVQCHIFNSFKQRSDHGGLSCLPGVEKRYAGKFFRCLSEGRFQLPVIIHGESSSCSMQLYYTMVIRQNQQCNVVFAELRYSKTGLLERYEVSEDREVYFRTTHTGKSVKYGWVVIVPSGISENLILRIFSMSGFVSSLRRASSSLFRIS